MNPTKSTSSQNIPSTNKDIYKCPYCWSEFTKYEEYKIHLKECGTFIYSKHLS